MARILVYLLLAVVAYFLLRTAISLLAPSSSSSGRGADSGKGSKMVKDPVCGVYIPEERAVRRQMNGETRYFCSEKCADEYIASLPHSS